MSVIIFDEYEETSPKKDPPFIEDVSSHVKETIPEQPIAVDTGSSGGNSLVWRCRAMFNGKFQISDLPIGCRRPQSSTGRTFPATKKYYEANGSSEQPSPNRSSTSHLSPRVDKLLHSLPNSVTFCFVLLTR